MGKSVIIIGGGLAGLASAVFLSDKGFDISVFESSPKWGGRTYSYYDYEKEIFIDNGQHILAGWYENTFDYLRKIGTYGKLKLNDKLNLDFFDKNKCHYKFRCGGLPGVYSLLWGIFKFKGFDFNDKLKFLKVRKIISNKHFTDEFLKKNNTENILYELEQTENLKKYFWNPLILATFNTVPENVSADLFVKFIKKGTEFKKNMSIILSDVNLNDLFVNKAIGNLNNKSVKMNLNNGVNMINIENNCVSGVEFEDGKKRVADFYICTVPYFSVEKLFEKNEISQYICNTGNLKSSTIISVHLFLKEDFEFNCENEMLGLVDTVVQWVFVKNKRYLCLVISGADFINGNLTEKDSKEIFEMCLDDLKKCLNGFDEKNVIDFKVIKEKRATFIPEVGSENFRIKQKSNIENLYFGGDWTDTEYPATIEGAIKSAKICADLISSKQN
jgi:hydroxysqualene dehydroxylase